MSAQKSQLRVVEGESTSGQGSAWAEILRGNVLFSDFTAELAALEAVAQIMSERSFRALDYITKEGELGSEMFFFIEGTASIYKTTSEGERYKVAVLHGTQHCFFGEGAILDNEARMATIMAESACKCLVLERDKFWQFSKKHPDWAFPILVRITREIMTRLRKTNSDLTLLYNALVAEIRGTQ
jgi:CRP-like cAMP-binding protein